MAIDLFLWPMLLPMILPLAYSYLFKREKLAEVLAIAVAACAIVVLYGAIVANVSNVTTGAYVLVKTALFVGLPLLVFLALKRNMSALQMRKYGLTKMGLRRSLTFSVILLPIMLLVTALVWIYEATSSSSDIPNGIIMFFESFTEEFFFRGIVFVLLLSLANVWVAWFTSFSSFILMHSQYYLHGLEIALAITVVQSLLTVEIARRSSNITGSWILHGANRFFSMAVLPLF